MDGPDRTGQEKIRHCRTISWTEGSLGRERRLPFHDERTRRGTRTTSSLLFKLIRQYVETWTHIGILVDVRFSCHSHGTLKERRRTSRHWWSELEREREVVLVSEWVSFGSRIGKGFESLGFMRCDQRRTECENNNEEPVQASRFGGFGFQVLLVIFVF